MQINSVSPSFKGFVRIYSNNDSSLVNTSNILGFNSSVSEDEGDYFNSVTFADDKNEVCSVSSYHKNEDSNEIPYGIDFEQTFAKACHNADSTGDIINIVI